MIMIKHRKGKRRSPKAEEELLVRLASTIRAHRKKHEITQEELAWRAGMDRTYIADLERRARNPTLRTLAKLSRALHVSVRDLLL